MQVQAAKKQALIAVTEIGAPASAGYNHSEGGSVMDLRVDNWDDLRVFLALTRAGSVAAAARALGVDPTTVTRRVTAFEEQLGVKLFDRLRGGVLLSPDGEALARGASHVEQSVHDVERNLVASDDQVYGTVRIACPELLALGWTNAFLAMATQHPGLDIQWVAGDDMHSLSRREADIALRVTANPPPHLIGRKLASVSVATYGARTLDSIAIEDVPWVGWTGLGEDDNFIGRTRAALRGTGPYCTRVNTYGLLLAHVRAGAGVSVFPCLLGESDEYLVRRSPPQVLPQPLWLLTHPDLQHTPRIRVVLDELAQIVYESTAMLCGEVHPS